MTTQYEPGLVGTFVSPVKVLEKDKKFNCYSSILKELMRRAINTPYFAPAEWFSSISKMDLEALKVMTVLAQQEGTQSLAFAEFMIMSQVLAQAEGIVVTTPTRIVYNAMTLMSLIYALDLHQAGRAILELDKISFDEDSDEVQVLNML